MKSFHLLKMAPLVAGLLFTIGLTSAVFSQTSDSIQADFTVTQVDSLIQANVTNPDFCVMDVRTPAEYDPEHLEGAINRNYNGAGFDSLLDLLPRHKMYVLYCLGGGRSGATFNKMVSMGFPNVVNTLGGITAWKNAGLPTTPDYASLLMAVSDTIVPNDSVFIGTTDTILLTLTNRANDTLRFTSVTSLAGTEFNTDFDIATWLEGPFDYTFALFYTPTDTLTDFINFVIESNGGTVQFSTTRTGKMPLVGTDDIRSPISDFRITNYPNPFSSSTTIEFVLGQPGNTGIMIYDQFGQVVGHRFVQGTKGLNKLTWDAGSLPAGVYVCRIVAGSRYGVTKLVLID